MRSLPILASFLALALAETPSAADNKRALPAPVVDLRVGLSQTVAQPARNPWQGMGQGGIVQLHQGHVSGVLVPFSAAPPLPATQLAVRFARFRNSLASTQAFDASACSAAPARIGTWFQLEAPDVLAAAPDEVPTWVARGVRVFSLAGRQDSALASSAFPTGPERVVGLTAVGQKVVGSVLSAGALVDVANLSDTAILDVLSLAKAAGRPVIATRGSAREVRNRPGSLSDWQLRGIASSGGVVGLSLDRDLLGDAQGAELGDVLRQVDHLLQVAGPESIAIASGFETGAVPLAAVNSATRFPRLAAALAAHGISDPQIRKLFRDNAVRVLCGSTTAPNANGG